jgi:hypothetical protein
MQPRTQPRQRKRQRRRRLPPMKRRRKTNATPTTRQVRHGKECDDNWPQGSRALMSATDDTKYTAYFSRCRTWHGRKRIGDDRSRRAARKLQRRRRISAQGRAVRGGGGSICSRVLGACRGCVCVRASRGRHARRAGDADPQATWPVSQRADWGTHLCLAPLRHDHSAAPNTERWIHVQNHTAFAPRRRTTDSAQS